MKYLGSKTLETKRLILRKIEIDDYEKAFYNWTSSDIVSKYVLWEKHNDIDVTYNLFQNWIKEYDDNKTFRWIVVLKENNDLIGTIDVSKKYLKYDTCEIGYCYSDKYWNKGYASEALKIVIKYLFERS